MDRLDQIIADMPKRCAVAELIGYCEGIINSGILGAEFSARLRCMVDDTAAAHGMQPTRNQAAE